MMTTEPNESTRRKGARTLRFDRARLTADQQARLPYDAHVEIDDDETAYLCVEGRRLFFAGSLERLRETLERLYLGPVPLCDE